MDLKSHSIKFKASLSNGETVFEGKGNYEFIEGALSPWQRLLEYTAKEKVFITSLALITPDGRTFNLPSAGNNPKFRPFALADKPLDFNYCHYIGNDVGEFKAGKIQWYKDDKGKDVFNAENASRASDWFTVIEAIYPDYKLQLWVDENNNRNSWVLVVKN